MADTDLTITQTSLSASGAKLALAAAEEVAVEKGLAVSIAVVDNVGNLLSFQRVNNACVTSIEASIRKARTAANLSAPTKLFEDLLQGGMTSLLTFEFISPSQGGVPFIIGGTTIGGIGCSGSTGEDDEMIANAGAAPLSRALVAAQQLGSIADGENKIGRRFEC